MTTSPDVNTMSLEAVQAELASYRPATASEVVTVAEHLARRRQLWRRLDSLKNEAPAPSGNSAGGDSVPFSRKDNQSDNGFCTP